ncbi:MFS transporter [Actinoallomurus bryophytorum]|uniref:Putative MFS family arabinose efflux permease n=1 Tax=Actinoallomurus bryophytorum TaxID=1490222 RepID=A0A543CIV7_9ACTN|nr:MFS transporter [Actinoallomurus bryophytorum]TQL97026.1 putative MFS family arabinose efflux permease [Actinoallomurus bryophytorum]
MSGSVAEPPAPRPAGRRAMFAALAVPNFRRYVSGQALSLIGTWVETVAQALLVLRLTHSGVVLGLTTAARYAPVLLLSPYAGLLVDRYPKRHLLLGTQAGLALVSALLGVSVLTRDIRLWQVVVLAVAFGTLSAVDNPARQAFVQEVVGRDLVRNAVTLNSTSVNVARVIGPTIAAVLVSTVGLGWCFVVNAASFVCVIVSLLSLDAGSLRPVPPVSRGRGQLRAGLRYAAGVPAIIRPLLMIALVGTFTFEFEVSLPLLARVTFHGTETTYSWLLGALGAGAVAGGLSAARSSRTGVRRLTRTSFCYAIAMGLLAAAPTLATAVAACVLVGAASVIFLTTGNSTIQLESDPAYRGRVIALWSMALVGSTPIGSPIIGATSDVAGPRYALALGAAACLAATIVGRWAGGGRPVR